MSPNTVKVNLKYKGGQGKFIYWTKSGVIQNSAIHLSGIVIEGGAIRTKKRDNIHKKRVRCNREEIHFVPGLLVLLLSTRSQDPVISCIAIFFVLWV